VHRTSLAFAVIVLCCWRATKGDAQTATTERQKATVFLFASPRGGKGGEKKKKGPTGEQKRVSEIPCDLAQRARERDRGGWGQLCGVGTAGNLADKPEPSLSTFSGDALE